ncbi:MAG: CDP-alcohol phosphatidyltransferase family protein [Alphaproteobacteria bacterium]
MPSWDQRMGRFFARGLVRTPITPNHVSFASLLTAVIGTGLFAAGEQTRANWGAVLFILGRLLDHVDGELARLTGKTTRFGYYLDYLVGTISYVALFVCLGIGFRESLLGEWALVLGFAASASALVTTFVLIGIAITKERRWVIPPSPGSSFRTAFILSCRLPGSVG